MFVTKETDTEYVVYGVAEPRQIFCRGTSFNLSDDYQRSIDRIVLVISIFNCNIL